LHGLKPCIPLLEKQFPGLFFNNIIYCTNNIFEKTPLNNKKKYVKNIKKNRGKYILPL